MVYGVDTNNNIVLASLSTSGSTNLSADSTALAFTRILLGALPSTVTSSQINAAIRATAEYPNLVAQITAAVDAGTAPSTSTAVFNSLNIVISQISVSDLNAGAAVGVLATETVTTPTPYYLLKPTGSAYQSVAVTGTSNSYSGDIKVSNNMSIAWSVASKYTNGKPLCPTGLSVSSSNPDCSTLITSLPIWKQLVNSSSSLDLSATTIPGNGDAFNITLEQTNLSRVASFVQVLKDGIQLVLAAETAGAAIPLADKCASAVVGSIFPPSEYTKLFLLHSQADVESYFKSVLSLKSIGKTIYGCLGGNSQSSVVISDTFLGATANLLSGFGKWVTTAPLTLANSVNIGMELGLIYNYWDDAGHTFGVCVTCSP